MAANPLTFPDLEAFCRLTRTTLSAWQVNLLMRVDDAALAAMNRTAPRVRKPDEPLDIPATNGKGVGAFLRSLAAKKSAQIAASPTPKPRSRA